MQDRFRIDSIVAIDFRCFPTLELALHPELTLLVGPNGQGKSAVIDAISHVCGAHDQLTAPKLKASDVRVEIVTLDGGPERRPRPRAALTGQATVLGRPFRLPVNVSASGRSTAPAPERSTPLVPFPVLARYSADRLVAGEANPDQRSVPDPSTWWEPRAFWPELVTWMRRETLADLQRGSAGVALRAVRNAIVECLGPEGITDLYYDVRTEALRVVCRGTDVPFDLASGGVKALVGVVADLAARAFLANPDLGERAPAESPGLVLVDEVELHLHPTWQRAFLPGLRRTFPNLQIVATTHSPQVVGTVAAESVRVMSVDGVRGVEHTRGRDTNTLLEDVFDTTDRDPEAAQHLRELFRAIDRGDPSTPDKLARAERELGRDDPDVARARFMLEMAS